MALRGTVPSWRSCCDICEKGISSLSRVWIASRTHWLDLHTIVEDLVSRGVSVRFLRERQTYSAKADLIAKLMLGLMGSVAEFERSIIKERQAEGIDRAKVLTDAQVGQARGRVADGVSKAEVARRLGIGRTTLYTYLAGGAG